MRRFISLLLQRGLASGSRHAFRAERAGTRSGIHASPVFQRTTRYFCPGEVTAAVLTKRSCTDLDVSSTTAALGLPG